MPPSVCVSLLACLHDALLVPCGGEALTVCLRSAALCSQAGLREFIESWGRERPLPFVWYDLWLSVGVECGHLSVFCWTCVLCAVCCAVYRWITDLEPVLDTSKIASTKPEQRHWRER
jgi:hypothetical protein